MILAHGSGVDDAAFVVLPLLVFAAVRLVNRRRPADVGVADTERPTGNDVADSAPDIPHPRRFP
jgi:hypothetical protein